MKSIANQYRDLKEGRMSQSNFMRNVRMMMPQYITNVTSFKDAVRILKSKSIITELGPAAQQSAGNPEEEAEYKSSLIKKKSQEDDEEEIQALIDKYAEEESGKYTTGEDQFEIGEGDYGWDDPRDTQASYDLERLHDYINQKYQKESGEEIPYEAFEEIDAYFRTPEFKKDKSYYFDNSEGLIDHILDKFVRNRGESEDLNEKSYKVSPNAIPVSSLSKGDILAGSNLEVVSISAGAKTPSGKIEVTVKDPKTGNEVTKVWNKATKVTVKKDLKEAKKKKEAKAELNPNQIHPQELRMGIKVELKHTDDLDKAKKIALDHLAENPYYYTALKLAGVESPSAPKVKAPVEKKAKKKKEAVELVDKANAMQKVKMPKDKINEDYESWLSQKKGEEARAKKVMQATNAEGVKFSVNDIAKTPDGKEIKITGFTTGKDGKMKAMYSAGMFADVYNLDDLEKKPSFRPGVDLGASFEKFKASLEEVVREVIAEYYDGRDNLDAENEY